MGIWVEIRCENRQNPSAKSDDGKCNMGIGDMSIVFGPESPQALFGTLSEVSRCALNEGWEKTQYGWICGHCARQESAIAEMAAQKNIMNEAHYRNR